MSVLEDAVVVRRLPLAPGLALIFDLDGVIVDSMPLHALAWRCYLEKWGIGSDELESRMHGRRNDEIVREYFGSHLDAQAVFEHGAAKERLFREMMREQLTQNLVPGALDFLMRAQTLPVALATNAEPANVDFVLDGACIRGCFKAVVDGTQVAHAKPAPDVYLCAAEKLGIAPANCIVFEDSPVGIEAARQAGTRIVGILTHQSLLDSPALDFVDLAVPHFLSPELEPWLSAQQAR